MSTHQKHLQKNETYFITFTCYKWLPLFEKTGIFEYFKKWFNYLSSKQTHVLGYVIMPNHFHGLLHVTDKCHPSLNQLVGNGKRFLAYEIIRRLQNDNNHKLLRKLQEAVSVNEKDKNKHHQVFIPSFDAKLCFNMKMLEQKLDYIHANPVAGKWKLVQDRIDYQHSSARFYELDEPSEIITHYKEVW